MRLLVTCGVLSLLSLGLIGCHHYHGGGYDDGYSYGYAEHRHHGHGYAAPRHSDHRHHRHHDHGYVRRHDHGGDHHNGHHRRGH